MNYLRSIYNTFTGNTTDIKKNDDSLEQDAIKEENTDGSSSDSEYASFLPKRKQVRQIKEEKEEALILDNIELKMKPEKPPVNIRGQAPLDSFEIHRVGTDCYLSENIFYKEFINQITRLPEYRKATSVTWPDCLPPHQTALFVRDMDTIDTDIINLYYSICKRHKRESIVSTFMEESLKDDTPWKIERLIYVPS